MKEFATETNTISDPSARITPSRRRLEVLTVSLIGGLVLFFGLREESLGPIAGVGYVMLMAPAVIRRWRSPFLGFFPGFMGMMIGLHLPLHNFAWFVPIALPLLLSWHFVLQAFLARWLDRVSHLPAFIVIPLSLGAGEWSRAIIGLGDFNMYQVGTFLYAYPTLIQAAELIGAPGLSVLWCLPIAFLVDLARARVDGVPFGGTSRRVGAALAIATPLALVGYGFTQLDAQQFTAGPRVAIVQPALDHAIKETASVVRKTQQMTLEHVPPGAADMIAWPENAILANFERWPEYRDAVAFIARTRNAPVLFGTQAVTDDGKRTMNTAYLVDGEGKTLGRYLKVVLFPFTERRALPVLERWAPWLSNLLTRLTLMAWRDAPNGLAGERAEPLELKVGTEDWKFWTPICYESCYPELGREARRLGAQFFVNLTSEGWLGWGVSNNMMAVNVLRAVENRVGLVRAGNSGVSAFILPDGRVDEYLRGFEHQRLRLEAGVLIRPVQLEPGVLTFYTAWGDLIDRLWPAAWLALFVGAWWRGRRVGSARGARA